MYSIISTIAGIIGAFLLANKLLVIGYIFFLVGSFCGMIATLKNDTVLCIQFFAYTLCNVLGLYNSF